MNSLILTLDAGAGCCLPIAYQQLTQGALYAAWRGSYPQLHDEGFAGDGQTFRLFTFGPLEGRYRVQGNEITFTGLVQLEVRSPVEDLLYALGKSQTGSGGACGPGGTCAARISIGLPRRCRCGWAAR